MIKSAVIINGGLIVDRKLNQIRQTNANGVRVVVNNQTFTLTIPTPIAVTFSATSIIYYNIVTNVIEHSTATATGNNATHFEIARWNDTNKRWIGNENNVTYLLADADVKWNVNKLLYITPNVNRGIVINLLTNVITIDNQLIYQFSDTLNTGSLTASVNIDISTIADNKTIYLYFDQTNNTFIASAHDVKPSNGLRELYFVTSFRKDSTKSATPSFNQHAIKIVNSNENQVVKMFALGDSLTHVSNWVAEFAKFHPQAINITNAGMSGTLVTNVNANAMVNRIDTMANDTNLLVFFGGTNDNAQVIGSVAPIGSTFDDMTFIGAYQKTIEKAYVINPKIRIILVTPPQRFDSVNIDPIVNAIKEVANVYNLPLVDLYKQMGLNSLNQTQYLTDLLHFNNFGGSKVARMILDSVNQNF